MTTPTRTRALLLALTAPVAAWAGTALALAVASGVTRLGGDTYDTEFISSPVYVAAAALGVTLAGGAAWWSWRWAVGGLVLAVAGLVWGGTVTVGRYAESSWGDGLEVFVYLVPLGAAVVGSGAVAVAALLSRRSAA